MGLGGAVGGGITAGMNNESVETGVMTGLTGTTDALNSVYAPE